MTSSFIMLLCCPNEIIGEFDSANFNFLVKIRDGLTIAAEPFL